MKWNAKNTVRLTCLLEPITYNEQNGMTKTWDVVCRELFIYFWCNNDVGISVIFLFGTTSCWVFSDGLKLGQREYLHHVTLSVTIVDTFDAMLYDYVVILLHYIVSSVSTLESFAWEHYRFHVPVNNSKIRLHLSARPNVQVWRTHFVHSSAVGWSQQACLQHCF